MKNSTIGRSQRPAVEALEDRLAPAGDIFAGIDPLDGVTLVIEGDQEANAIAITTNSDGTITLEGKDDTTINGNMQVQTFTTNSFRLGMGDGDDLIAIDATAVRSPIFDQVFVDTERGNDTVHLTGRVFFLNISTGDGDDDVIAEDLFAEVMRVETGNGRDSVELRGIKVSDSVLVSTGKHADYVLIDGMTFEGLRFQLVTGAGNDTVQFRSEILSLGSEIEIILGDGKDVLEGDTDAALTTSIQRLDGGKGHDTLLNSDYFDAVLLSFIDSFEVIDD